MRLWRRVAALLLCGLLVSVPVPAFGWANGGTSGFGTHDWVLNEGYRLASVDGAGWLDLQTALNATGDPDIVLHDTYHHVYDVWGSPYGDADAQVALMWNQVVAARNAGNYTEASRLFGLLSHYYSDVCNPLHTDQCPSEDSMHSSYETAVNGMTDVRGENSAWVTPDGLATVTDPAAVTVAAATASHADYDALVNGYIAGGTSAVSGITQRSLNRAANGLADMIETLESGYSASAPALTIGVDRIGGANRYDVAINLANQLRAQRGAAFTDVIVACGEDRAMADPLGAGSLAAAYECPILLTPTAKANLGTLNALAAMRDANGGAINIHVVGGKTSIPSAIFNAVAARRGTGSCERIDAANRYALAWKMADRVRTVMAAKGQPVGRVMVVNIEDARSFNDALAASPISARSNIPLIGVRGASVPSEAYTALSLFPGAVRCAVNSAFLTPGVRNATGCSATLANSANREVAATQIASFGASNGLISYTNIGVVNKLSDALPAGALMGQIDGVLLYTGASPLSATTGNFAGGVRASANKGWVFGGPVSITDATRFNLQDVLNGVSTPAPAPPAPPSPPANNGAQVLTSVSAWVSNPAPTGGTQSVFVKALDQRGAPINGASVSTSWHYKSTNPVQGGTTGSDGVATISRPIGSPSPGYTVVVNCTVTYSGVTKTTSTSFTPQ